ncbi:hypothetical protein LJR230_001802 [Trinickia sp. LjRoot230]|uniref:RHS repeat-associated core domain-containing protein n=1 Tax=Trinickia sp. LjRoot230 TaxID=3342288 RepID=UPI003ED14AF9
MLSNRSTAVRMLRYNRRSAEDALDELIEWTTYDSLDRVTSRVDARLFASGSPNFAYISSLSGRVIRTDSVDAGTQWTLCDIDGRPVWALDARRTGTTRTYDELGRPLSLQEALKDQPLATREVWVYGENQPDAQAHNLRGQCVYRYDGAGKLSWTGFRLTGQPLDETRQLLIDAEAEPDWKGGDASANAGALDTSAYTSAWTHDATGTWTTQTDAKCNVQRRYFDVAGRLASSSLMLAGGTAKPVLSAIDYSAAGQVLSETAGNGALSTHAYEPQTQRLIRLTVTRPAQASRATTVQDLSYTYDPVGNVVQISDAAQATSYWRNQKIQAAHTYGYDALYQLINATGREMANRVQQSQALPPATIPLPADDSVYVNYSRTYTYDRGGNLTQIQHQGAANYTQAIVVSDASNHAMSQNAACTLKPADIDGNGWFDAAGNAQFLSPDHTQPLGWSGRNRLQRVTLVKRDGLNNDDREAYQYDSDNMRVRKRMTTQARGVTRTVEVIYLPGLTLRVTSSGDGKTMTVVESLQEVNSEAGSIHARCLHWEVGQPASATGDMMRYGASDPINSIGLELDDHAALISHEEYYPYGGTAVWAARSQIEADTKFVRYSGKERDATGLYYYGYRYYQPWIGRWLNSDPAGTVDGLNLYRMVRNNPVTLLDSNGLTPDQEPGVQPPLTHEQRERAKQNWGRVRSVAMRLTAGSFKGGLPLDPAYHLERLDPQHRYGKALEGYRKQWEGYDTEHNFFDWLERALAATPRNRPHLAGVRYLQTSTDRNQHKVDSFAGNTVRAPWNFPRDQRAAIHRSGQVREAMFVMDKDNNIYIMHKDRFYRHHSSLMGGAQVRAAGMISMDPYWKIIGVEAESGHYRPKPGNLAIFLKALQRRGADLNSISASYRDNDGVQVNENAHALVKKYDSQFHAHRGNPL